MDWEQRCIRLCAGMILFAILLRLWAVGALTPVGRALESPEAASFFLYLQTGRVVRYAPAEPETEPTDPAPVRSAPVFSAEDADFTDIDGAAELLTAPLDLNLTGEGPRVLILHTHTTESFTQTDERYEQTSPYRTLDPGHNMIALGEIVAQTLQEAGIEVLHDTAFHDYPSYNGSYTHAAEATRTYLEQYPTIELILDLHRDAADTPTGQMATKCSIGGESAAQLMFVLGTDQRLDHPDWERNLSLALKLQVLLERENPGICREVSLSKNRYNQHLGKYALLVEIGAAGNTLDQAKLAARELGEAIAQLVQ
ncbi:MAG: stage II sporulation protein P [Oscillospiraceae bacterium]|nr:stage II sporulation protein P [Oscillospiraceae bacterium]